MPHLYTPILFWSNAPAQILTRSSVIFRNEIAFPVDFPNHSFYTPSYLSTMPIPALDSLDYLNLGS